MCLQLMDLSYYYYYFRFFLLLLSGRDGRRVIYVCYYKGFTSMSNIVLTKELYSVEMLLNSTDTVNFN